MKNPRSEPLVMIGDINPQGKLKKSYTMTNLLMKEKIYSTTHSLRKKYIKHCDSTLCAVGSGQIRIVSWEKNLCNSTLQMHIFLYLPIAGNGKEVVLDAEVEHLFWVQGKILSRQVAAVDRWFHLFK